MSARREELLERLRLAAITGTNVTIEGPEAREILLWWQWSIEVANLNRTGGKSKLPRSTLDEP